MKKRWKNLGLVPIPGVGAVGVVPVEGSPSTGMESRCSESIIYITCVLQKKLMSYYI
jgi:hypothetical protein